MICAIVLAAGRSQRMGMQKLLLPWGNKTIIGHVVDEILAAPVEKVFVIVRPEEKELVDALAGRNISFLPIPKPDMEMLESIRLGVRALPPECDAVLVVLGDQPLISAALISELVNAFRTSDRGIVIPHFKSHRGHPMLFSTKYCDAVLHEFEGVGLHGLHRRHPEDVLLVPVASPFVLDDVDTPEAYERLRRQCA